MAKMKIEVLAARAAKHGLSLRDRLVGYLPRYAKLASRFAPLANWRNNSTLMRKLFEQFAGISAQRALPEWRRDVFRSDVETLGPKDGREVVLFADTFNRAYERKTSTPRCTCWSKPDTVSIFRSPRMAAGHCAAAGRFCQRVWSITPAPNWIGWSRPMRRSRCAACPSSAWSRAVC